MKIDTNSKKIKELLTRGVKEVIVKKHLEKRLKSGKKLRVKFGIDPTAPDIHLGHSVPLLKLKQFQDLGHQIIIIIGDWTASIGDPSGRNRTRSPLSQKEIAKNCKTYIDQISKILDRKKTEFREQNEWCKKFDLKKVINLESKFSVPFLLSHKTFRERLKKGLPFMVHEVLYPLLQAYDSLVVKADIEIGAVEQKFNLLTGRELQKKERKPEQDILMTEYLMGLDGKRKMSKSFKNYIAFNDPPSEMYGKIMSIPDNLIGQYFELATKVSLKEISKIKQALKQRKTNPKDLKARLAREIVTIYHSKKTAQEAEKEFKRIFKKKETPSIIPEIKIKRKSLNILDLLIKTKMASSKSEAKRLVEQGGVRINKRLIENWRNEIQIEKEMIVQAGKRKFIKIRTN